MDRCRQGRARAVSPPPVPRRSRACARSTSTVFADLKLHDIPTTVGRAARVLGRHGVSLPQLPRGGRRRHAARRASTDWPKARARPASTRRDADRGHGAHERPRRVRVRRAARGGDRSGCGGVVCSVQEVERVHAARADFVTIVPGVRFADGARPRSSARRNTRERRARRAATSSFSARAVTAARDDPRAAAQRASRRGRERASRATSASNGASRKPSPSCDGAQSRYAAPLLDSGWLAALSRSHQFASQPVAAGGTTMANPPTLTPEQRQLALEKAARRSPSARRGEGQAEDRFAHLARAVRRRRHAGRVGRHAREAEGRQRARVACRASARCAPATSCRSSRSPRAAACAAWAPTSAGRCSRSLPADARSGRRYRAERDRRPGCPARPRRHVGRGQGHDRCPAPGAGSGAGWSVSWTTRPAGAGELEGVDYHFVTRAGVRAPPRRRWLPRVVRGLRRPEGHPEQFVVDQLAAGHDVLLEIDVQGALAVKRALPGGAARLRAGPEPGGAAPPARAPGQRRPGSRRASRAAWPGPTGGAHRGRRSSTRGRQRRRGTSRRARSLLS